MTRHNNEFVIPETAKRLSGIHSGILLTAIVGLIALIAPQAAQSQACAGTTVSPSSPSNTAVGCDSGTTVLDITGTLGGTLSSAGLARSSRQNNDDTVMTLTGAGTVVINIAESAGADFGTVWGGVDSADYDGDITINNAFDSGGWSFVEDATVFGSGNDTLNNAGLLLPTSSHVSGTRVVTAPLSEQRLLVQSTVSFGDGEDVINNTGVMVVGDDPFSFTDILNVNLDAFLGRFAVLEQERSAASEAVFEDLETFNNSGLIVLGAGTYVGSTVSIAPDTGPRFYISSERGEDYCRQVLGREGLANPPPDGFPCTASVRFEDTDRMVNDVLSMPGTRFVGSGASAIKLDAEFGNGRSQGSCEGGTAPADRIGDFTDWWRLPAADCVDLRNGETDGSTQIIVRDALPSDQGAHNPEGIVIVDVAGGTSAEEHFTLSPASDSYAETDSGRGVIDQGLFVFPLIYNESTQQHMLIGIPGAAALQMPLIAQAAQDVARQSTASGLDERQQTLGAALRAGTELSGGFWGSLSHTTAERDVLQPVSGGDETFVFNNDFERDDTTLTLGRDFVIPAADKSVWLWGGSVGYVRSDLSFDKTPNSAKLEGVTLGLHGGYQTGAWFANLAINQSFLQVQHFVPTYNLPIEGSGVKTDAQTQGAHLEGGYRFALTDALHVEPLAGLSWVKTNFDEMEIFDADNPAATRNTVEFDDSTSLRAGLGARLTLDTAVRGLNLQYALTARAWNETDGESDVTIKSTGPDAGVSDTFDGTFTEVQGSVALSNADDSLSGFLNIDSGFGDDYDSLGAELGFRYQW